MRLFRKACIVGLVASFAWSLFDTSSARAQAPKLRVAYTAFAGTFTILWIGKDAGLYQKYGADMELLYIGSSTKSVQALLGGDIDIMYSAAGAVVDANLAGADLVMFGFRELLTTEAIGLPFDYDCFIVKNSLLKTKREELKRGLRANLAAYDLAIADPAFAKRTIGKYTRTTDAATLDETYKENVKDYALRIPYVSLAGVNSILEFRAESSADVKKLALGKIYDNSLLQEIQKETSK